MMDITTLILWLVIGGIAGALAGYVVRGFGFGLLGNIIVGIIGAFVGGFIFNAFGSAGVTGINLWSLFVAFVGAVVLLVIIGLFTGHRSISGSV
jgi:uncharacterized membrane protein YeaQ/YmgE (transglycosylase-associated protein family)